MRLALAASAALAAGGCLAKDFRDGPADAACQGSAPVELLGTPTSAASASYVYNAEFSFNYVVPDGNHRLLLVTGAVDSERVPLFEWVELDGVPLVKVAEAAAVLDAGDVTAEMWFLVDPPVGSGEVTIFVNAPPPDPVGHFIAVAATTFGGVDAAQPIRQLATAAADAPDALLGVPSEVGDLVVDVLAHCAPVSTAGGCGGSAVAQAAVGPNQALAYSRSTANLGLWAEGSTKPGAAGNVEMTWTFLQQDHAHIVASLRAACP